MFSYKYGWHGNYQSWESALSESEGYDSEKIINKVRVSSMKVKNGEAAYERDGVLFYKSAYSTPLISTLMLSLAKSKVLNILDFGGSLGNAYYQTKKFLDEVSNVSWSVVEQKHFVDVGNAEFKDDRLKFYYSITECIIKEKPNVLLLSSVLQYLERPYEMLEEMLEAKFDFILIDRTPYSLNNEDVIKLQKVPPSIYKASYPCWFLSEMHLKDYLIDRDYKLIEEFDSIEGRMNNYTFKGMIWKKND
jgi:putative methyltransferase (TIGR04325 family)